MKANPDNRWRKMPPGSADSLPPSNAKPYTPSHNLSNGVNCGKLIQPSSLQPDQTMSDQIPQSKNAAKEHLGSAPKPFKKRYLASNQGGTQGVGSSSGSPVDATTPPSPSPVPGVSPDAAQACEALIQLSRTDSRGPSRSSEGSGSERRGSPSETQPLQTLREAVWSKVATTLLKQEEDKLVEPPKDSPMNLSNAQQCTIRGQQIIEHIIENILDKPMEGIGSPCEPINVSVNNNQEEGIKASIYESLKNDLLKGKVTSAKSPAAPPTPPGSVSGSTPAKVTCTPVTKTSVALVLNQGSKLPMNSVTVTTVSPSLSSTSSSPSMTASHSPNSATPPGHQDVLRLLARNSQLPINVGNSAITITKTPRVAQSQPATSVAPMSPTPVSVSLTRTGSNQVFNLGSIGGNSGVPVVLSSQPGVMLTTHPPQGSVVLTGVPGHQPSECVLLSPTASSQGLILQQAGVGLSGVGTGALQQGQVVIAPATGQPLLIAAGSKLILAPSVQQAPPPRLVQTSTSSNNTNNAVTINNHVYPVTHNDTNSDPVNLSVRSSIKTHENNTTTNLSVMPQTATLKRPASISDGDEDDIRRSSRQSKGKRYQEFIEDGRINLGHRSKRRSHKSGEGDEGLEGEIMDTEPLVKNDYKVQPSIAEQSAPPLQNNQINHHWKKKLRTVSLGENTHSQPPPPPAPSHLNPGSAIAHPMSSLPPVTLTASNTAPASHHQDSSRQYKSMREDLDPRNNHRSPSLASRSTRQSHNHPNEKMLVSSGAGGRHGVPVDVKLGNKKMRGEKISH